MKNNNEQTLDEKYEEIVKELCEDVETQLYEKITAQLYEENKVKIEKKRIILWVVTTLVMGAPIVAGIDLLSIVIKNKLIMKKCRKAVLEIANKKEDTKNKTYEGEVVA